MSHQAAARQRLKPDPPAEPFPQEKSRLERGPRVAVESLDDLPAV
jgi:hypothetical protein